MHVQGGKVIELFVKINNQDYKLTSVVLVTKTKSQSKCLLKLKLKLNVNQNLY